MMYTFKSIYNNYPSPIITKNIYKIHTIFISGNSTSGNLQDLSHHDHDSRSEEIQTYATSWLRGRVSSADSGYSQENPSWAHQGQDETDQGQRGLTTPPNSTSTPREREGSTDDSVFDTTERQRSYMYATEDPRNFGMSSSQQEEDTDNENGAAALAQVAIPSQKHHSYEDVRYSMSLSPTDLQRLNSNDSRHVMSLENSDIL